MHAQTVLKDASVKSSHFYGGMKVIDYERFFSPPALFSGWSPFHADTLLILISVPLSSSLSVVMLFSLL
jgi:hypothetical protein